MHPQWDPQLHLAHPPSPDQVAEAWDRYPHAAGALIVSPTPYGTCADIAAIAAICHEHGRPLIVDEAWGALLPFHDQLPTWAMDAGADVCVVSVHKMGAGFEQGSVLHVQGDRIDFPHLSACADLLMTTSPNVLVYAAIDGWRRQMVEHGEALLQTALDLAIRLRREIDELPGLRVLEDDLVREAASHDLDRLQILIDVSQLQISGYQAADWLREHELIDMGLSDHAHILATLSMADDASTTDRLLQALKALIHSAGELSASTTIKIPEPSGHPRHRAGRADHPAGRRLPPHRPASRHDPSRSCRPEPDDDPSHEVTHTAGSMAIRQALPTDGRRRTVCVAAVARGNRKGWPGCGASHPEPPRWWDRRGRSSSPSCSSPGCGIAQPAIRDPCARSPQIHGV